MIIAPGIIQGLLNIATGRNLSRQSNALIVTSGPRFIFFRGAGFSFPSQTSSSGPFPPASSPCSRSVPLFFLVPGESFLLPSPSPCWVHWGLDQFKTIWLIKRPLKDFQRPNICKQIAGPPRGRTENLLIKSQSKNVSRHVGWYCTIHLLKLKTPYTIVEHATNVHIPVHIIQQAGISKGHGHGLTALKRAPVSKTEAGAVV